MRNFRGFSRMVPADFSQAVMRDQKRLLGLCRVRLPRRNGEDLIPASRSLVLFINALLTPGLPSERPPTSSYPFDITSTRYFSLWPPLHGGFRPPHRIIFGNYLRYPNSQSGAHPLYEAERKKSRPRSSSRAHRLQTVLLALKRPRDSINVACIKFHCRYKRSKELGFWKRSFSVTRSASSQNKSLELSRDPRDNRGSMNPRESSRLSPNSTPRRVKGFKGLDGATRDLPTLLDE